MAYLRVLMFAGLGILAAIFLLPQTRWVPVNHIAFLSGQTPGDRFYGCLDPEGWPTATQEERLAQALWLENPVVNKQAAEVRLGPLDQYCREHPDDAAGWACLLRMANKMILVAPGDPRRGVDGPESAARRMRNHALMEAAIRNGERLEPQNNYFTVLKVALLESEGKHYQAQEALRQASRKSDYNDYTMLEGQVAYRTALKRSGYRGTAMELSVYADVMFPDAASISGVLPFVPRDEKGRAIPDLQLAAIRTAHAVAKHADAAITVFVMKNIFNRVVSNQTGRSPIRGDELQRNAAELDRVLKSGEVEADLLDFGKVKAHPGQSTSFSEDLTSAVDPPVWAGMFLLAILLCVPSTFLSLGVSSMKMKLTSKRDRVRENPGRWCLWSIILCLSLSGLAIATFESIPAFTNGFNQFGVMNEGFLIVNPNVLASICGTALVVALMAIPRRPPRIGMALAVTLALLPLAYFGLVVRELRRDQAMKGYVIALEHQVDEYRGQW